MDGQATDSARGEHHQGRDVTAGGGSEARADGGGGRGMERTVSRRAENALRSHPRDEEGQREEAIKKLKQKVGELVLENDVLKEAVKPYLPFGRGTSDE